MADTLAGTKTIGRYTLKAYSKNSTLGYYVKLYDLDKYIKTRSYECPVLLYVNGSWVYNDNCKYTSYSIAIDAFLYDEWSYFFNTKPGKSIIRKDIDGRIDLGTELSGKICMYRIFDKLGYKVSSTDPTNCPEFLKDGGHFDNISFNSESQTESLYLFGGVSLSRIKDGIDSFYGTYFRYLSYTVFYEKDTVLSFKFPSYKSSVYDTRIQTDCCLLVLCEPTKYKL